MFRSENLEEKISAVPLSWCCNKAERDASLELQKWVVVVARVIALILKCVSNFYTRGRTKKKQRWNVIIVSLLQSVLECFEFFEDLYIFVYIALYLYSICKVM